MGLNKVEEEIDRTTHPSPLKSFCHTVHFTRNLVDVSQQPIINLINYNYKR